MKRTAFAPSLSAAASAPRWHSLINGLCDRLSRRLARTLVPAVFVHSIARTHAFWIVSPRGRRIVCETGALWLTFDNELRDIVLEAGQQFECDSAARLGIYALADARVRVQ